MTQISESQSELSLTIRRNRFKLREDSRKKLCDSGMNVHRLLNDCIWRFSVHDIQQNMDDLIAACAQNGSTQDLFAVRINDDLDEAFRFTLLNRSAHILHRIL